MWRTRSHEDGLQGKSFLHTLQDHDTKACRKHHNSTPSPTNCHIPAGYHPTATPPPLMGAAAAVSQTQQAGATDNGPRFQNLFDTHQPRNSTTIHTPFNGASPAPSANMTEALTQIIAQVTNNNKKDNVSKKMMKNIKIFEHGAFNVTYTFRTLSTHHR